MTPPPDSGLGARIAEIQRALHDQGLDAWLFNGFRQVDPLTRRVLLFDGQPHLSRRWFYLIPARGAPRKLRHRIEPVALSWWPGEESVYLSWRELEAGLAALCRGCRKIAMHYSPLNSVPTVSLVDAGTLELVRQATGAEVVSSADLVQLFEAVLTPAQIASHEEAAADLYRIVAEAYAGIGAALRSGRESDEYSVQQSIVERFDAAGLVTDGRPIVAVNEHSGDPHYAPTREARASIRRGDLVLIDLWAKRKGPDSVFADITWVGFAGPEVPEEVRRAFEAVRGARDAAFELVKRAVAEKRAISGAEVDDACRDVLRKAGLAEHFIHRTGHSIGREVHGNGCNIDNLETRDTRRIISGTCFSIEPGVYLPRFGVRSEIDVLVDSRGARVTGGTPQSEVLRILG